MDFEGAVIALLLGIVSNLLTFLVTRRFTTKEERADFRTRASEARATTADNAIGHLRSSHLAIKQLELSVRQKHRDATDLREKETLWGVVHSLQQIKLQLVGHMNAWKNDLASDSPERAAVASLLWAEANIPSRTILPKPLVPPKQPVSSNRPSPARSQPATAQGGRTRNLLGGISMSPQERVMKALVDGDVATIEAHVERLVEGGEPSEVIALGGVLALNGSQQGYDSVLRLLDSRWDDLEPSDKTAGIVTLVQFRIRSDTEVDGRAEIEAFVHRIVSSSDMNDEQKAHSANQMQMLLSGAELYEDAITWGELAVSLSPDEPAYRANLSMDYTEVGDHARAIELFEQAYQSGNTNHKSAVETVLESYRAVGDEDRARQLEQDLETLDPIRSAFHEVMRQLREDLPPEHQAEFDQLLEE